VSNVRTRTDVTFKVVEGATAFALVRQWQAERALAKVPESVVRRAHQGLGIDVELTETLDETEVIMGIMRHFGLDLQPYVAEMRVSARAPQPLAPDTMLSTVDTNMLRDVVLPKDQEDVRAAVENRATVVKQRREHLTRVVEAVAKHFVARPASKAKGQPTSKFAPFVVPTVAAFKCQFKSGDRLEFINTYKPRPANIVQDNPKCRYLVAYEDFGRRCAPCFS
jgi:hypothetical protein